MPVEFDEYEKAVLQAIKIVGGVTGREWFRADRPELREAFDRLLAKKYISCEEPAYFLAADIADSV